MAEKNNLKRFVSVMAKKPSRWLVFFMALGAFLTVPSQIIFSVPNLAKQAPIYQDIDLIVPTPFPYPVNKTEVEVPYISARSAIIVDVSSKAVIYEKFPDVKLPPASTTKLITALVALDEYDMAEVASVSSPLRLGQTMELLRNENISNENLLKGLLIQSANDAADHLARMHPQGYDYFITLMNHKAESMGALSSHFRNPIGLDQYDHYTTVHDLALIGAHVMDEPILKNIVGTKFEIVTDTSGEIEHELENINELLGVVPGLAGVKTGWTEGAGECLVSFTQREDRSIIVAILGSYDRFGETKALTEWVFENFEWEEIE